MQLSNDLFIRLINHRVTDTVSRKEDFLTEIFCWILGQDHTLCSSFLQLVGLSQDNQTILSIQTQVSLGQYGRVDAQIKTSTNTLLVECKVDAPYDPTQIQRYLDYAKSVNAKVLAIIPAIQSMDTQTPDHPDCIGIWTWETIYTWLSESMEKIDPILQPHINSLLALMRHYRLEPINRSVATWEDQSLEVNRKYIRAIGAHINTFVPTLNTILEEHANPPKWYQGSDTEVRPWNGSGFLYSGKGPAPRPRIGHNLEVISKFGYPWGRLDFCLTFLSIRRAPRMHLQFWIGDANNTLQLLSLMGVDTNETDGVQEHNRYQRYMYECMTHIAKHMSQHFPMFTDIRAYSAQGFVGVVICDTNDVLAEPNETHLLKSIAMDVYETGFKAFLDWDGWRQDCWT